MPETLVITAPSRLHFGMFSFGQPGVRQFGGVGAMIDKPGVQLRISPAEQFGVTGPLSQRVWVVAERVLSRLEVTALPRCQIEVLGAPREHVGLGTGTQISLSVAAALCHWLGRRRGTPQELAALAGRAERSAIGTYGFATGGLLLDGGKSDSDEVAPLMASVTLPAQWRFVLILPRNAQGISGQDERSAFGRLPPVPPEIRDTLVALAINELVPAADTANFERFSQALYQFGYTAGLCFARCQHGAYATPQAARLVEAVRQLGAEGAGQSSWGPAIFALTADQNSAEKLVQSIRGVPEAAAAELVIAPPNNQGAVFETE